MDLAQVIGAPPRWYQLECGKIAREVKEHPLTTAVMRAEPRALRAFYETFWPFTGFFGSVIWDRAPAKVHDVQRAIGSRELLGAVTTQQLLLREIDGSHRELWERSAASVGVYLPAAAPTPTPAMAHLLTMLERLALPSFYISLATIEVIAEALADAAEGSPLSKVAQMRWFDVHRDPPPPSNEAMCRWIGWRLLKVTREREPVPRFVADMREARKLFIGVANEIQHSIAPVLA